MLNRGKRVVGLAMIAIAGISCSEPPRAVRVIVDTDLDVPGDLDEVRVTVTASRTDEGNICEPVTRIFTLDDPSDVPLPIMIEIGSEYSAWLAFRVVARLHGEQVFFREVRVPWPTSGRREVTLDIVATCYRYMCGENEQCVERTCVGVPQPGIFDDVSYRDRGVPCDRAAAVEDVGAAADDSATDTSPEDADADVATDGAAEDASE